MKWINAKEEPIVISGLLGNFNRVPDEVHEHLNDSAKMTSRFAAGGRVRFATDSSEISVKMSIETADPIGALPLSGITGCDVYINDSFTGTFAPADFGIKEYEFSFKNTEGRAEININLPVYTHVLNVEIGLLEGALVEAPRAYKQKTPVVFYGSSITNGAAVASAGNAYPARLSRAFDFDYINLGFGGGCRGEVEMAEYIATLDMSMLVIGYDHNAINAEELEERHERFFKIVREKHPTLPILLMSKPDLLNDPVGNPRRRDVIYRTYSNAQAQGDENVYFLDGSWMYGPLHIPTATVDGIHPKDETFARFADILTGVFKLINEKTPIF